MPTATMASSTTAAVAAAAGAQAAARSSQPGLLFSSSRFVTLKRRRRFSRVVASASSGSSRGGAGGVGEVLEDFLKQAKQKVHEFGEENDVRGRAQRLAVAANQRMEELGFELRRSTKNLNRKYRITQRGQEFADFFRDQVQAADSHYRIRQRARTLSLDFRMKWPTYRRQAVEFLDTPLGKLASTVFFVWFVLSGWIFRVFVLSMWLLPIAAPLLIGTIARNAIVEGACPNCKTQFFGSRSQVVVCRSCRNVVWQPRDDFSKGSEDPSIIDIDVDKN